MIVLSERDVAVLLPMDAAIEVVAGAMINVSQGDANLPLRSIMDVGGPNKMGMMPGSISDPPCHGIKLVSLFPGNPDAGYSSHQGAMVLFEAEHGSAIALMNAGLLTAIRTAAASAVATRALARTDSRVLTIVGTGEQANHHLDAMIAVRPIEEVRVVGRRPEKAEAFAANAARRHPRVRFGFESDVREAVAGADIVCTVTSASEPVLLGEWILPGTHLNVVGASVPAKREIDETTVRRAALFVDYRPSSLAQAGEIIAAIAAGGIAEDHILAEIGQVLPGSHPGRTSPNQITLYRSLGIAAQDLACAAHCVAEAKEKGRGSLVEL